MPPETHVKTHLYSTRQQVEAEIHHALLKYDGLVESAATNQGAWLTESAGALSDLHAAVLRSLSGFSLREKPCLSSGNGTMLAEADGEVGSTLEEGAVPSGAENSSGRKSVSIREGGTITSDRPIYRQEGAEMFRAEDHGISAGGEGGVAHNDAATYTGDSMPNAANSRDSSTATSTTTGVTDRNSAYSDKRRDDRRARLQDLGLLLARKRQFTASRQVGA